MTGQGLAGDRGGDGDYQSDDDSNAWCSGQGQDAAATSEQSSRGGAGDVEQGGGVGSCCGARARRALGWARLCVGTWGGEGGLRRRDLLATDGAAREI